MTPGLNFQAQTYRASNVFEGIPGVRFESPIYGPGLKIRAERHHWTYMSLTNTWIPNGCPSQSALSILGTNANLSMSAQRAKDELPDSMTDSRTVYLTWQSEGKWKTSRAVDGS